MNTLKKTIVAISLVAIGAAAAYADCPSTINVESGGKTYSCSNIGTTSGGGCVYGNCTEIKKVAELQEAAEMAY